MLENIVYSFLKENASAKAKILIGVSGGVDSMVLLSILYKLKIPLAVAHFNFMLRNEEANLDQQLVEDYCKKNDISFFVKKQDADQFAKERKIGIQEAAREMRYSFFREIMGQKGITEMVTAHHADDQVETILFNLLRASGIQGLQGMPEAENNILRPLIRVSKDVLYKYAQENAIPFREDKSNTSTKYQRNFLRNQIIPLLEERFPNAQENILQAATYLSDINILYKQRMQQIRKKMLIKVDATNYRLAIRKLKQYEAQNTILFELFKSFSITRAQLPELVKLLDADNGARLNLADYVIYKDRNFLLVQSKQHETSQSCFIEKEKGQIRLRSGELTWVFINTPIQSVKFDKNTALLDAKGIELPFRVRSPRAGDYFYPLGMQKKKKLARYFIDHKFSPLDKKDALVLEMIPRSGNKNKRIMWLIGERIDNRFRIAETTRGYYKFTFKPNKKED